MVDVDELVAAIRNPKLHDLDGIGTSMLTFGYADTVLIDERTVRTISGHGRVETVQRLRDKGEDPPDGIVVKGGKWYLPVIRGWASENDAAAEAYLIAANRWGERAGYDRDLLATMIGDLAAYDEELVRAAGYDELEQHDLLAELADGGRRGQPPGEFPPLGPIAADYRCPSCDHEWNGDPRP